jgi:hypothetical protein
LHKTPKKQGPNGPCFFGFGKMLRPTVGTGAISSINRRLAIGKTNAMVRLNLGYIPASGLMKNFGAAVANIAPVLKKECGGSENCESHNHACLPYMKFRSSTILTVGKM